MVIMGLLNLTRALLYPNERIAWLSLLRAPWCGLDMQDLHQVDNALIDNPRFKNNKITLPTLLLYHQKNITLSTRGDDILKRFNESIKLIPNKQKRDSLRNWIEGAWLQLGGDALLLNKEEKHSVNAFLNV
ncbi:MAG: ATP-dependent exoDNAse (exonuclease V) beta subunit [Cellvibrionaceae bacterium]|jgi:ATP-dependent exoDNAse (exonuclease V) beta subunit